MAAAELRQKRGEFAGKCCACKQPANEENTFTSCANCYRTWCVECSSPSMIGPYCRGCGPDLYRDYLHKLHEAKADGTEKADAEGMVKNPAGDLVPFGKCYKCDAKISRHGDPTVYVCRGCKRAWCPNCPVTTGGGDDLCKGCFMSQGNGKKRKAEGAGAGAAAAAAAPAAGARRKSAMETVADEDLEELFGASTVAAAAAAAKAQEKKAEPKHYIVNRWEWKRVDTLNKDGEFSHVHFPNPVGVFSTEDKVKQACKADAISTMERMVKEFNDDQDEDEDELESKETAKRREDWVKRMSDALRYVITEVAINGAVGVPKFITGKRVRFCGRCQIPTEKLLKIKDQDGLRCATCSDVEEIDEEE